MSGSYQDLMRTVQAKNSEIAGYLEELATVKNALRFANRIAASYLAPFEGLGASDWVEYSCWGCNGKFESTAPRWTKPTLETFPHEAECEYVKYCNALSHPVVTGNN